MAAGPSPTPLPAERHAPATLLRRSVLPKLTHCFRAQTNASARHNPKKERGKLREAAPAATADEVAVRRLRQRWEFERLVGHARAEDGGAWARYARWEESHGDLPRARDVWERAIAVAGHRDPDVWVGYAEFEARYRCAANARGVWERALALIPPSDGLWRRYAQMEEGLGSYAGARQVFGRYVDCRPGLHGWLAYAGFELRNGEVRRARAVYERLVRHRPGDAAAWARFAEFEARHGGVERTRECYERAMEAVTVAGEGGEGTAAELVSAFAEFEERCGKTERARDIYRCALERLPEGVAEELRLGYKAFESRHA